MLLNFKKGAWFLVFGLAVLLFTACSPRASQSPGAGPGSTPAVQTPGLETQAVPSEPPGSAEPARFCRTGKPDDNRICHTGRYRG